MCGISALIHFEKRDRYDLAPLLTMLNACSANVVVVNIDCGFKAGYVAALIARRAGKPVACAPG